MRGKDWEVSVHTTHTSRSQSWSGTCVSHVKNARTMQLEIDRLKVKLRYERRRRPPSNSDFSSDDDGDGSYRPRSRTPPSESFSCDEDTYRECRNKGLSWKGLGNDAISRALNQNFRLPFTRRIKGGKLPKQFAQPIFTMYNSRIDLVEHVSHFN